ncbi:MAG: hypothetical protein ACI81T_003768, partial [Bacteroidia bacterium]
TLTLILSECTLMKLETSETSFWQKFGKDTAFFLTYFNHRK